MILKKRIKKIVAREFLIAVALIIITGIIFISIIPYNSYFDSKIKNIELGIESKLTKEKEIALNVKAKIKKQEWYQSKITNEFENLSDGYKNTSTLWTSLQKLALNDSLEEKYNGKWGQRTIDFHKKIGFKTSSDFKNYILTNTITKKDSFELKQSRAILEEIELLKLKKKNYKIDKLDYDERIEFTSKALLIFFIVMFLLRYTIYAIKWSLNILRT